MEAEEKKLIVKRVESHLGSTCRGCFFNAGGECWMPQPESFDVEIEEGDTLPPYRCCDRPKNKYYIYLRKEGGRQ